MPTDVLARSLGELNRHLGPDRLDDIGAVRGSITARGPVFETPSGAVYFVHRGAAWRLVEVGGGTELTCWHNGREMDRIVLDPSWRDA